MIKNVVELQLPKTPDLPTPSVSGAKNPFFSTVQEGADPQQKNSAGKTAFDLAKKKAKSPLADTKEMDMMDP